MKKLTVFILALCTSIACAFAQTDSNEEEMVYNVVETMPEFPGGNDAMQRFINNNMKRFPVASKPSSRGRVVCECIVEKDGTLSNIEVVRAAGDPFLNSEAVRIIESMPRWNPGKHNGETVRVKCTIPINFKM